MKRSAVGSVVMEPGSTGCTSTGCDTPPRMNVLAAGGSLTEAKELLGHTFTITTMAYAKVDVASLRELVVPFGQVPR